MRPVPVRVFMGMEVCVLMSVVVLVFVFAFHDYSSFAKPWHRLHGDLFYNVKLNGGLGQLCVAGARKRP